MGGVGHGLRELRHVGTGVGARPQVDPVLREGRASGEAGLGGLREVCESSAQHRGERGAPLSSCLGRRRAWRDPCQRW